MTVLGAREPIAIPFEAHLKNIPDRLRAYISNIEFVDNGVTAFAAHPFADWVTNDDLIGLYSEHNPLADLKTLEDTNKAIAQLGVKRRACSPPLSETRPMTEIVDENIAIGALLTRRIMTERNLEKIDFIHVGSALLPADIAPAILDRAGLSSEGVSTFETRAAYASGLVGFIKAVTDPKLRDKNGIILTLESLGGIVRHPRHYQDQIAAAALFGDMHVGMGINTANFRPIAWRIRIIPGGGIGLDKAYDVDPTRNEAPEHLHLELDKGAELITQVDDKHLLLDVEGAGGIGVAMYGQAVYDHFTVLHPALELDVLQDYIEVEPDGVINDETSHDPSRIVGIDIFRRRRDQTKLRSPLVQALVKNLRLEFLLPEMEDCNSSSSTVMKKWMYKVATDRHKPHGKHFVSAPGIGSALAAIVYEYVS